MIKDHLGNEFKTQKEMCIYYGIAPSTYCRRIQRGWTLEEALIGKQIHVEFNGKYHKSIDELCFLHGISRNTYRYRIKKGWTLDEILDGKKKTDNAIIDHLGKTYPSKKAMCESHGIKYNIYKGRISHGWSVEQALTIKDTSHNPRKIKAKVSDPYGNLYDSIVQMCKAYGVSYRTYQKRISRGLSKGKALLGNG